MLFEDTVLAEFLVRLPETAKPNKYESHVSEISRSKCLQIWVTDRENGSPWVALVCSVMRIDYGIQSRQLFDDVQCGIFKVMNDDNLLRSSD